MYTQYSFKLRITILTPKYEPQDISLITPERLKNKAKRMMFLALKESVFFTMFEIHTNVRIFITLSFVSPSRYLWIITLYKVNRCLARYSLRATTTNQPTNGAPNKPASPGPKRPNLAQNWHFWSIWARPSRLIQCSVGGCGAQAVSRKTPIFFI